MVESITFMPQLDLIVQMMENQKKGHKLDLYKYQINDKFYMILDNQDAKVCLGEDYNFIFLKKAIKDYRVGFFMRWGKTVEDNPKFSPIGPEILDIEISTNGCPNACPFCYKNNKNLPPTNMTLDIFKSIINKFPKTLTQVAFGITGIQTNPDFIPMMEYCRSIGVIPNFTLSGIDLTDEIADKVSKVVGALAVSAYSTNKNVCYDTVKKFTDRGIDQTNIHIMVSKETLPFVYEVLNDRLTDPRLSKMHAIVFLGVKPKGRAKNNFHSLSKEEYAKLVEVALSKNIPFGFDSCSAPKFEATINLMNIKDDSKKQMIQASESCESDLFSSYINVYGEFWHCSFSEEEINQEFVDVIQAKDFFKDVWYSDTVNMFRQKSLASEINGCRCCTVFPEINN